MAEAVGREIGKGAVLFPEAGTGNAGRLPGSPGGGRNNVGILPATALRRGNPYLDIPITTGLDLDYRSLILVHSCDALIMIGGKCGTLTEFIDAYKMAGRWLS